VVDEPTSEQALAFLWREVAQEHFLRRPTAAEALAALEQRRKLVLRAGVHPQFPRLRHVWLDAADNGQGKGQDWIEQTLGWTNEIVQPPPRSQTVWVPNDLPPEQIDWSRVSAAAGFPGAATPLGGGAHVRLARPAAPAEQGV
jgi:hypothetical protein